MQPVRAIYVRWCNADTVFHRSATGKRKAGSLKVQRSPILPPCISQFYARVRFSATRDTTSSTDNHYPAALQRCQGLLNGTPYGYLRVRHRPAMCVSLSMNASCCASVLPSTHDYAYRACDTSTTASRIAPTRPKMLSIVLVYIHWTFTGPLPVAVVIFIACFDSTHLTMLQITIFCIPRSALG